MPKSHDDACLGVFRDLDRRFSEEWETERKAVLADLPRLKDSLRSEHPDPKHWMQEEKARLAALKKQDFSTLSGRMQTGQWVVEAAIPPSCTTSRNWKWRIASTFP